VIAPVHVAALALTAIACGRSPATGRRWPSRAGRWSPPTSSWPRSGSTS